MCEIPGFIENSRCYPEEYPYFLSFLLFVIAFLQSTVYGHSASANNTTRISRHYRTACLGLISCKSRRILSVNQQQNPQKTSKAAAPGHQVKAKKGGAGIGKVATLMSNDCEKIGVASASYLNVSWQPSSEYHCKHATALLSDRIGFIRLPIQPTELLRSGRMGFLPPWRKAQRT